MAGALLLLASASADIIPADRRAAWSGAGVSGGIPTYPQFCDVTQAPYSADNTGSSDA